MGSNLMVPPPPYELASYSKFYKMSLRFAKNLLNRPYEKTRHRFPIRKTSSSVNEEIVFLN